MLLRALASSCEPENFRGTARPSCRAPPSPSAALSERSFGAGRRAQVLLDSIHQPAPSLTQLLLGFEVEGMVERSSLQPTKDFTCLRVLLAALRPHPVNAPVPPQFLEQALWMLHELAADRTTAFPLFDWLRAQDVLATQVRRPLGPYVRATWT